MSVKQEWFDGWVNVIEADDDFQTPAILVIDGFRDADPEEELDRYESPTREPKLVPRPGQWSTEDGKSKMPWHDQTQAWGGFAVALGSISNIVGGSQKCYQQNHWKPGLKHEDVPPEFVFQFVPGPNGFQEGRL